MPEITEPIMRHSVLATLTLLLALSDVHAAKERMFIDEPEPPVPSSVQEGAPWEEGEVLLPPWPDDADLVEFTLDSPGPFRYFIDARHLSIGRDGVVRYTLVAESSSGSRNVSYEGLRCKADGVYQVYAYGAGGRFQALPGSEWQRIRGSPGDELHRELHGYFLCAPRTLAPRPVKDMVRALRGNVLPGENSGFMTD
jgi:hypothetical protein